MKAKRASKANGAATPREGQIQVSHSEHGDHDQDDGHEEDQNVAKHPVLHRTSS